MNISLPEYPNRQANIIQATTKQIINLLNIAYTACSKALYL